MGRHWFGGTLADFVVSKFRLVGKDVLILAPHVDVQFWNAETGGTQVTDLLLDGAPTDTVSTDASGFLPAIQGPDDEAVATNHAPNPSFETGTATWGVVVANDGVIEASAEQASVGSQSMKVSRTGSAGSGQLAASNNIPWDEADPISLALDAWIPSTNGATGYLLHVQCFNDSGAFISPTLTSPSFDGAKDEWVSHTLVEGVAPHPGTASLQLKLQLNGAADGDFFYVDAFMLNPGATPHQYFDGDTEEHGYLHDWSGDPHDSASVRYATTQVLWADAGGGERARMITTDGAIDLSAQLSTRVSRSAIGAASGVASLDASGRLVQHLGADQVDAGVLAPERIPGIDAAKITSGLLDSARIPKVDNPHVRGATLYSYGHSYTIYPSPYTTPETGEYPELLRRQLAMGKGYFRGRSGTPLQDGISGALSPTLAAPTGLSGNRQWVPDSRGIVLLQNYANEGSGQDPLTAGYLSGWKHALRTFMALTGAKNIQKWADKTASSGTWTQLGGGANRFWDDEVYFTSEGSATIEFSVTGDEVWLLSVISTATYSGSGAGAVDVFVNSTTANPVHLTHDPAGKMDAFTSSYDGATRAYTPTAVKITGLDAAAGTSGAKTIIVRTKDAGSNHFINGVIEPMPDPPHVFVAKEPPRNPGTSGAATLETNQAAFRGAIDEVALEFPGRMHVVDLAPGWQNPAFVSSLDTTHNFHPNDLGMQHIADTFAAAINAEITEPISGVLTL